MALMAYVGDQALRDDGTLHAGAVVMALKESKSDFQEQVEKLRYAIAHYVELLDDAGRAARDYEKARGNIPYIMQGYFQIKGFRI